MITFLDHHTDLTHAGCELLVCWVNIGGIVTNSKLPLNNSNAYLIACSNKTLPLGGVLFYPAKMEQTRYIANCAVKYRVMSKPIVHPVAAAMNKVRMFIDRKRIVSAGIPAAPGIPAQDFEKIVRNAFSTCDCNIIISPKG